MAAPHCCDYPRVQPNVRHFTDGMAPSSDYRPSLWTSVVALSTMGVYIGWVHILIALFVSSFFWRLPLVLLGLLCLSNFMPARWWPGFLTHWVFSHWRKYLHYSYLFEENMSPYNKYIAAQFPHGACPLGTILAGSAIQSWWPEFNAHCAVASFIFRVPGWRHMHGWLSAHPATKATISQLLQGKHSISAWRHLYPSAKQQQQQQQLGRLVEDALDCASCCGSDDGNCSDTDSCASDFSSWTESSSSSSSAGGAPRVTVTLSCRGRVAAAPYDADKSSHAAGLLPHPESSHLTHQPIVSEQPTHSPKGRSLGASVGILVGGIAEIFALHPDKEVVVLRHRKGFVRLAVEHGAYLVPTYHFGQSTFLRFGPAWLRAISRRLRMTFGFMYGPLGLPIPFQQDVYMVSGKAIPVTQMSPSDPRFPAYVDQLHTTFMAELEALYYRHRAEYGWADRPLVIT